MDKMEAANTAILKSEGHEEYESKTKEGGRRGKKSTVCGPNPSKTTMIGLLVSFFDKVEENCDPCYHHICRYYQFWSWRSC